MSELLLRDVERRFRSGAGVGPVSLALHSGEALGLVGPNGAGKTTLMHSIVGIERKWTGSITLDGVPVDGIALCERSFLATYPAYPSTLNVREVIDLDLCLRGIDLSTTEYEAMLNTFGLADHLDLRIANASTGMAKRVGLALAFAGMPKLIVLDEPLDGLDLSASLSLRQQVRDAVDRGALVIVSSHILSFLDDVATRVAFLMGGMVRADLPIGSGDLEETYLQLSKGGEPC
ncbi:MAG: ABC transporter ATP-binding protein [Coriobacteriaceae bacterium]|uniref:ABC transporter ATP-binding protein n=1 Tax=Tractidigestivibacter sp. TaxID=2847320 RepID=UPI002A82330A|nr:ABC transporter ATP-binding protein [Tractidigestivibacter sp.]MCI6845045.1 ABC transporter ATP-binding protein [Coriobacteriaceae bacterium]MCI7438147.1 ABC transporter ATP-binding protein [Coriobacteriaceae bacterium]MDD7584666.1 ABC transporter ATP-binding protein [Coriobacteriaceae bacterium]MDY4534792.1 ABC transporter ATP-binding protein [Tractidigestivibacter sp.]